MPTRTDFLPYVSFVVDDTLNGRELHEDQHAIVRAGGGSTRDETTGSVADQPGAEYEYPSVLVGWQCGFEPLFVAVHSYMDVELDDQEVEDLARDYLDERNWFAGEPTAPDYLIR